METVTFGHFSDVSWMGVPFVMSLTTMRAKRPIWLLSLLALLLSAVGTECEVLWFLLVGRTLLTLRRAFNLRTCFLVAGVIKEVVSWF